MKTKKTVTNPDHNNQIVRLNKIKGQLVGVEKMIIEKRYCPEIIIQIKAIKSALSSVEAGIFKKHLKNCLMEALNSKKGTEEKLQEVIKLVYKKNT